MSRLVIAAWALALVVFATPPVAAAAEGRIAPAAGKAASQNTDRLLKLAAEGVAPDSANPPISPAPGPGTSAPPRATTPARARR